MAPYRFNTQIDRQIAERITILLAPGLFALAAVAVAVNLLFNREQWMRTLVSVLALVAASVVWRLSVTARAYLAARHLVAMLSVLVLLGMALNGGVLAPIYPFTLVGVVIVVWFHGDRTALAFTVCSAAAGAAIVWLDSYGLIHPMRPVLPVARWATMTILTVVAFTASIVPKRMLRHALAVSEASRFEAEQARQAEVLANRALIAREAALIESEAFRRRVFDSSPMPIVVCDAETLVFLDCNPAATNIYGFVSREDTLGKTPIDVSAATQYDGTPSTEKARTYVDEAIRSGTVVFEWRHLRPDGELWDAEVHLLSFTVEGRSLLQFTLQDITSRKRAEHDLRQQAALLDITQDAVATVDADGTVRYWNPASERIYGRASAEVIHKDAVTAFGLPSDTVLHEALADAAARGAWSGEFHSQTSSRGAVVSQTRISLIKDDNGNAAGYLIVGTDVTESKQMERRLLRAQRMETMGTLASGIAHDLNNVLAPVVMAIELLKEQASTVEAEATVGLLHTSAMRAANIVRQLLTFARGTDTAPTGVDTRYLLAELSKMVERTFPRNIRFNCSYPEGVWQVYADATQVHQVLLNLCINARDALPAGGELTVAADNVVVDACYSGMNADATPGHYVRLRVTDSGTGIAPDLVERIFDPFFTTKPLGQGTGLGLAAVQTIVRRHHGFVEVDTQPDRGTEFRVYIPANPECHDEKAEPVEPQDVKGHGAYVLLVDDEAAIREIATSVLALADFTVATAPTGVEALRLLAERGGDVGAVIVDMVMPEMDGAHLIAAIHRAAPATPIVAMSGLPALRTAALEAAAGPVTFLQKPFTADELLQAIHEALGPGTRSQS